MREGPPGRGGVGSAALTGRGVLHNFPTSSRWNEGVGRRCHSIGNATYVNKRGAGRHQDGPPCPANLTDDTHERERTRERPMNHAEPTRKAMQDPGVPLRSGRRTAPSSDDERGRRTGSSLCVCPSRPEKKNGGPFGPPDLLLSPTKKEKTSAPTYSPGTLPSKYHRRSCVSRPSSEWDGVGPQRCEHGGVQQFCTSTKPAGRAREASCEERKKVKTSTDEHQSAQPLAGLALLAS